MSKLIEALGSGKIMQILFQAWAQNPYKQALISNLVAYNDKRAPPEGWEFVGFYALDRRNQLLGGIQGNFEFDWLHITQLWVKEPGKGLGSQLIKKVEAYAKERKKKGILLDTYEFQAKHFYQRHGFEVFGTIENAAGPYERYFMMKRIVY